MSKQAVMSPPANADILTAEEVSCWLRVPKTTLYKLCKEGRIPATRIGRHWRFRKSIIEGWLKDHIGPGDPGGRRLP